MKTNISKYIGLHLNALLFGNNSAWGHVSDPPEPEPIDEDTPMVGDWIICKSREDMLNTMHDLIMDGVETELRTERHGKKGLWLEVMKVDS